MYFNEEKYWGWGIPLVYYALEKLLLNDEFDGIDPRHKNLSSNVVLGTVYNDCKGNVRIRPERKYLLGVIDVEPNFGTGTPDVLLGWFHKKKINVTEIINSNYSIDDLLSSGIKKESVIFETIEVKSYLGEGNPDNFDTALEWIKEDLKSKKDKYVEKGFRSLSSLCITKGFRNKIMALNKVIDRVFQVEEIYRIITLDMEHFNSEEFKVARKRLEKWTDARMRKCHEIREKYNPRLRCYPEKESDIAVLEREKKIRNNNYETASRNLEKILSSDSETPLMLMDTFGCE
jgi:hypothetical protein